MWGNCLGYLLKGPGNFVELVMVDGKLDIVYSSTLELLVISINYLKVLMQSANSFRNGYL